MNNEIKINPFERIKLLNRLTQIIDNHEEVILIMIDNKTYQEKFYSVNPKRFTYHDGKFFIEYIETNGEFVEVTFDDLNDYFTKMNNRWYYCGAFANQVDAACAYNELIDRKKQEMGITGTFIFSRVKKFAVE